MIAVRVPRQRSPLLPLYAAHLSIFLRATFEIVYSWLLTFVLWTKVCLEKAGG